MRRCAEDAAIGLAFGCALAALLLTSLITTQPARHESAISLAVVFALLGLIIGLSCAWRAIPTAEVVINQIDSLFGSDALLLTAWQFRDSNDPWHRSVLALAEARCRDVRSLDVSPRRIGTRGWSAICMCAISLAVLTALSALGNRNTAIASSTEPIPDATSWHRWTQDLHGDSSGGAPIASRREAAAEPAVESGTPASANQTPDLSPSSDQRLSDGNRRIGFFSSADADGVGEARTDALRRVPSWTDIPGDGSGPKHFPQSPPSPMNYQPMADASALAPASSANPPSAAETIPPRYRQLSRQFFNGDAW